MLDLFKKPKAIRPPGRYQIVRDGVLVKELTWHKNTRLTTDLLELWQKQVAYKKRYVAKNPDKVREADKRYRAKHRDHVLRRDKLRRMNMTPEQRQAERERAARRREKIKADPVLREQQLQYLRDRYQQNKERYKAYAREYRARQKAAKTDDGVMK